MYKFDDRKEDTLFDFTQIELTQIVAFNIEKIEGLMILLIVLNTK